MRPRERDTSAPTACVMAKAATEPAGGHVSISVPSPSATTWNLRSTFALSLAGILAVLLVLLAVFCEYTIEDA